MSRIDQSLLDRADAAPGEMLAVIVTLQEPVPTERLDAVGLAVSHRFDAIHAVSGSLRGADLARLAALREVLRIEADSPMRALSG